MPSECTQRRWSSTVLSVNGLSVTALSVTGLSRWLFPSCDRSLQRAKATAGSVTAGLSYRATDKWRLASERFYSLLGDVSRRDSPTSHTFTSGNEELFNVRGLISYRVR